MSHDAEADWASAELARLISVNPGFCFSSNLSNQRISCFAGKEGKSTWPHADGRIELENFADQKKYYLAIEYKRPNEGLHGILTAVGQAHAYIHKGYEGCFLILPEKYNNFNTGDYVKNLIETTSESKSIGICIYKKPNSGDLLKTKLEIILPCDVEKRSIPKPTTFSKIKTETQWAHMREGSADPDLFYKYLQCLKHICDPSFNPQKIELPQSFKQVTKKLSPNKKAEDYLSNISGNKPSDRAWKYFWFEYILFKENIEGWQKNSDGQYVANKKKLKIKVFNKKGGYKEWFSERRNSIKNKLVKQLNDKSITISQAYEQLAENYHKRAHQERENIDSFLENTNLLDQDGRITKAGYEFVDAIERTGNPHNNYSLEILRKALITDGGMRTFLHYIFKLSEEKFAENPLFFASSKINNKNNNYEFKNLEYRKWLENEFANTLKVMNKVSLRKGETKRIPFQAEFTILKKLGLVSEYRVGVGLPINWPEVNKY